MRCQTYWHGAWFQNPLWCWTNTHALNMYIKWTSNPLQQYTRAWGVYPEAMLTDVFPQCFDYIDSLLHTLQTLHSDHRTVHIKMLYFSSESYVWLVFQILHISVCSWHKHVYSGLWIYPCRHICIETIKISPKCMPSATETSPSHIIVRLSKNALNSIRHIL